MAELPPISARLDGPFRTNIRQLLFEIADQQPCSLAGTNKWRITFKDGGGRTAELLVFEEDVLKTGKLYCEQCRVIGWGHHPVSCSRFHFILPSDDSATVLDTAERSCPSCEATCLAVSNECPQCGADLRRTSVLEVQSHLLHGVLHLNGFGHLMRVNGRERGSPVLSGTQLMDLWDRLCDMLKARDVSVQDVSKKYGLDFRILHAIAYGSTWYGRWGYKFGRGSFGVSEEVYNAAVELLQNLPLVTISEHFETVDHMVPFIIARYEKLSGGSLKTLSQLYCFMLDLRQKLPERGGGENGNKTHRNKNVQKKKVGHKDAIVKIQVGRAPVNGKVNSQSPFRLRGFIHGPLNGIARARTQNLRRPALKAGLAHKGKSSPEPSKPLVRSPAAASPKKSSPEKKDRSHVKKRKADPATREGSPAPRRTRQRLEEEARVLGLSGTGFKRGGSLDSEAALRRKAKRARLNSEERSDEQQKSGGLEPQADVGTLPPAIAEEASANGDAFVVPSPHTRSSGQDCKPAGSETPKLQTAAKVGRNKKRPPRPTRRAVGPQPTLQLSYSPPVQTMLEKEIGESGRSAGKHPIPEGSRSKLVRTFDSSRESTRSPSVDSGKSRYSPRRIDDAIQALVGIMRTLPENAWMTRVSLKEKARTKIGDTGLLNYALRVVENLEVGDGAVVRRMVHPDSHVMEYRLEHLGGQGGAGKSPEAAEISPEVKEAVGGSQAVDDETHQTVGEELGVHPAGVHPAPFASQDQKTEGFESKAAHVMSPAVGTTSGMGAADNASLQAGTGQPLAEHNNTEILGPLNGSDHTARAGEVTPNAAAAQAGQVEKRTGPSGVVQLDSHQRADRPRRTAGPLSPQKKNAGSASRDTLSKADVVKDLRYIHQQVVLTYKAARKIRRTGSINPALASIPTTPFGGPETPLETTPLGGAWWKGPAFGEGGEASNEGQKGIQEGGAPQVGDRFEKTTRVDGLNHVETKPAFLEKKNEDGLEAQANAGFGEIELRAATPENVPERASAPEAQEDGKGTAESGDGQLAHLNKQEGGESGGRMEEHREWDLPTKVREGNGIMDALGVPPLPVDPEEVLRATKAIHNTKKFIKIYHWAADSSQCQESGQLRVLFGVKLHDRGANPRAKCDPPAELLVFPADATLRDLKAEAGLAFQEVYVMMSRFRVTRVEGWAGIAEKTPIGPLLAQRSHEASGEVERGADVSVSADSEAAEHSRRGHVPLEERERTTPAGGVRTLRSRSGAKVEGAASPGRVSEQVVSEQLGSPSIEHSLREESAPERLGLCHVTGTGSGADLASEARFEAGLECWVVDCLCGTKDDDGERMAECDRCGTWMHTRCLKIRDRDSVPAVVVCARCSPGGQAKAAKGRAAVRKAAKAGAFEQDGPNPPLLAKPDDNAGGHAAPAIKQEAELQTLLPVREEASGGAGPHAALSKVAGLTWHSKGGPNGTRLIVGLVNPKKEAKRDLRGQLDPKQSGAGESVGEEGATVVSKKVEGKGLSGVKKKRSAAGGERRGPRNLDHLKAAVRDLAGGKG